MLFKNFPHKHSLRGAFGQGYIRLHGYTYVEREQGMFVDAVFADHDRTLSASCAGSSLVCARDWAGVIDGRGNPMQCPVNPLVPYHRHAPNPRPIRVSAYLVAPTAPLVTPS
jgi:hypothetical protein